jgi:hypothetical protein
MLASQIVGVHWLAMDLLRKANDPALRNDVGNLAVKLLRTFTTQLEALKRYRSAGEQRVVVQHQHVNVTADQAAVQVNATPISRGDGSKPKEPAHASAEPAPLVYEQSAPMQCPDPVRDAVPVADGAGKARCRMHGGAESSGGQPGNQNALKHGRYTAEAVSCRRMVAALLRACRDRLGALDSR